MDSIDKALTATPVALEDQQPQEVEMVRVPSYQPQKKQHSKEHDSPTTFKTEADSGVEPDTHGSKLQPDIDSHILERPTTASDHCISEKDEPTAVHDTDLQCSLGAEFRQATHHDATHEHDEFVTGAEREIKELKKKISRLEREVKEQRDQKWENRERLEEAEREFEKERSNLQYQLHESQQTLQGKISELSGMKMRHKVDMANYEKEKVGYEKKIKELKIANEEVNAKYTEILAEKEELKSLVEEAEETNIKSQEEIDELKKRIAGLEKELTETCQSSEAEIENLKTRVENLLLKLTICKQNEENLTQKYQLLQCKLKEERLKFTIEIENMSYIILSARADRLQTERDMSEEECKQLRQGNAAKDAEIERLRAQHSSTDLSPV